MALHKTQCTVCVLSEDRGGNRSGIYPAGKHGYEEFLREPTKLMERGYERTAAVESTGNARYFRNRLLPAGIVVKIVNTMKFKVVTESVKKTDRRDAGTLAESQEKEMLPESILCSQESEDIRRVVKSRSILVKALVSLKNRVHGLLPGYGIESERGQPQGKRERRRSLCGLEEHRSYGNAAPAVRPLLESIERIAYEV